MQYVIGFIAVLVIGGGIWAYTEFGTLDAPGTQAQEQTQAVSLSDLRATQQLANASFELIPGQVHTTYYYESTPSGRLTWEGRDANRYDIRIKVRNLHTERSLLNAFWSADVKAFDGEGREVDARILLRNAMETGQGAVAPLGELTGTILVIAHRDTESLAIWLKYNEPGRTDEVYYVWPYGR